MLKKIKEFNGLKFNIRDKSFDDSVLKHEILADFYRVKNPGVVVDIGAHIGGTTILCASRGADVYSYEPSKSNYKELLGNLERNNLEAETFNVAVGNKGNRKLYHHKDNFGCFSFSRDNTNGMIDETEEVETITIEEVFKDIDHCDLLKIDCEGGEREFYKAIPVEKIDMIAMEIHDGSLEIKDYLSKFYNVDVVEASPESKDKLFICRK